MFGFGTRRRRSLGSAAVVVGAATALALFTAGPASAAGPGSYQFGTSAGATFQQLNSNNLLTGFTDDALFRLSTTSGGAFHMPFAVKVYNKTLSSMWVSSNGNIQFGPAPSAEFDNTCLPTAALSGRVLMPFWDDLLMDPADTSHGFTEGIFTKTSGRAPHRKFLVSWQGHAFRSEAVFALAQVTFTEGSQTLQFVYGNRGADDIDGNSATIGVQSGPTGSFKQFACGPTTPATFPVFAGLKVTWLHTG